MIFRKTITDVTAAIASARPGPTTSPHSVISPLSSHPQRKIPPTKPTIPVNAAATADRTDAKIFSPIVVFIRGQIIVAWLACSKLRPDKAILKKHDGPERMLRAIIYERQIIEGYSAAGSIALVVATVQSGAPTLKRAKRRTVMFSPSLPTRCAINSLMLTAWSLMKGCSSRQTSS